MAENDSIQEELDLIQQFEQELEGIEAEEAHLEAQIDQGLQGRKQAEEQLQKEQASRPERIERLKKLIQRAQEVRARAQKRINAGSENPENSGESS